MIGCQQEAPSVKEHDALFISSFVWESLGKEFDFPIRFHLTPPFSFSTTLFVDLT